MTNDLPDPVLDLVEEASTVYEALRARPALQLLSTVDESLVVIHDSRLARDNLEHIHSKLLRIKLLTATRAAEARLNYEQAFGEASTARSAAFAEYASAKEREASIDLKILSHKLQYRRSENQLNQTRNAIDIVHSYIRTADSRRSEAETRIRSIHLLSSLER